MEITIAQQVKDWAWAGCGLILLAALVLFVVWAVWSTVWGRAKDWLIEEVQARTQKTQSHLSKKIDALEGRIVELEKAKKATQ